MKKFISTIAISAMLFAGTASAAATMDEKPFDTVPNWQFSNVSLNKLDWSSGTHERSGGNLKDFTFIEIEGGAGFDWGDTYGFLDIEDFTNYGSRDDIKLSGKYVVNVYTPIENVSVYHQTFVVATKDFDTADSVLGLSYRTDLLGVKVAPFAGVQYSSHDADFEGKHNFSGMNGYMFGWSAMYNFEIGSEKFSATNWHEITVGRTHEYLKAAGEAREFSQNGALSLWWHPTRHLTTGIQYRYGDNKIGTHGNANAAVYTIKYNF